MRLDEFLKHEESNDFVYRAYSPMGMCDDDVMIYANNGVYHGRLINIEMHANIGEPMNQEFFNRARAVAHIELLDYAMNR